MDECLLCTMEGADESSVVFRDPLWAAEVVPGYDVPGWFILRARRHAERITGLDDEELSSFGRHARDLVAAVTDVTGAPATYLLVFGENYPHFHALIAPRGHDVPPELRAGNLLKLRADHADPAAAEELVRPVRSAYDRHTARPASA
jgi:diadenosine tetraphosphate (Ap4A) HIT family hydrolase